MTYQPPLNGKRISIKADDNPAIETGEVTLAAGNNVTLDQNGNTITVDSSAAPAVVIEDGEPIPEGTQPNTIVVRRGTSEAVVPPGTVNMFAGASAPNGWLLCDGSAVSRETYADLFAVIGTTYGSGDGSTTFNLPNLKGRVPVGLDSGQTEFDALGETGGEKEHTLTNNEVPPTRVVTGSSQQWRATSNGYDVASFDSSPPNFFLLVQNNAASGNLAVAGGGEAHNNLQPYIVMHYIIKA